MTVEPVTADDIRAAHWHFVTHERGRGFSHYAYACVELPELTLTHGLADGVYAQLLHVAGASIVFYSARHGGAGDRLRARRHARAPATRRADAVSRAAPPMTAGEKRAYVRGYARGRDRGGQWALKLLDMLKAYRARLADVDTTRQCQTCSRWTRGQHGPARWGKCAMAGDSSAWLAEPGAWPDHTWNADRSPRERDLVTHEHFGCTNWLPIIAAKARS